MIGVTLQNNSYYQYSGSDLKGKDPVFELTKYSLIEMK